MKQVISPESATHWAGKGWLALFGSKFLIRSGWPYTCVAGCCNTANAL